MARPDPNRSGSERDPRRPGSPDTEATDAGERSPSQGRGGARPPGRPERDDPRNAPESGDKPEAMDKPAS